MGWIRRHLLWSLLKQLTLTNHDLPQSISGTAIRAAGLISLITVNWWHSETIESIKQIKLGRDDVCFPSILGVYIARSMFSGKSPGKCYLRKDTRKLFLYFFSRAIIWVTFSRIKIYSSHRVPPISPRGDETKLRLYTKNQLYNNTFCDKVKDKRCYTSTNFTLKFSSAVTKTKN